MSYDRLSDFAAAGMAYMSVFQEYIDKDFELFGFNGRIHNRRLRDTVQMHLEKNGILENFSNQLAIFVTN